MKLILIWLQKIFNRLFLDPIAFPDYTSMSEASPSRYRIGQQFVLQDSNDWWEWNGQTYSKYRSGGSFHVYASATSSGNAAEPFDDDTPYNFKSLYIGGAGDVVLKHSAIGTSTTYYNVPAGTTINHSGVRIMSSTTASNITWKNW